MQQAICRFILGVAASAVLALAATDIRLIGALHGRQAPKGFKRAGFLGGRPLRVNAPPSPWIEIIFQRRFTQNLLSVRYRNLILKSFLKNKCIPQKNIIPFIMSNKHSLDINILSDLKK